MTAIMSNLIGGVGLLLIGMSLMTDGLKLASGHALRGILGTWTKTSMRGLLAGFLVTGIVQSSSAVTVATISFANAGMLTLERAVWVIYGSNVGTTMTAWIVVLVGFKIHIDALALPLIGLGALLKMTGNHSRRNSAGLALVGFGLLFLGINFLKTTFEVLGAEFTLPVLGSPGLVQFLLYALIGLVLTTLMQSSSAAMVITLSAAQGGLVPLGAAAAIVIGANLGTTTTALLSVLGASPTAKRVAASHVAFNLVTAIVAILILPALLWLVLAVETRLGLTPSPALTLAIFHSVFNLMGVLLMWPLSSPLLALLRKRFTTQEELESSPRHMDKTLLALPYLAADAIVREVTRINQHTISAVKVSLRFDQQHPQSFEEHRIVRRLTDEVAKFSVELSRTELTPVLSDTLASLMESTQQYLLVIDIAEDLALMSSSARQNLHQEALTALDEYLACIHRHMDAQDLGKPDTLKRSMASSYDEVELYYRKLKDTIPRSATRGALTMEGVDVLLQYVNQAKRACRQLAKANQRLLTVHDWLKHAPQF